MPDFYCESKNVLHFPRILGQSVRRSFLPASLTDYMSQKETLASSKSACTEALLKAKEDVENGSTMITDETDKIGTLDNKIMALRSSRKKKERDTDRLKLEIANTEQELEGGYLTSINCGTKALFSRRTARKVNKPSVGTGGFSAKI